MRIFPLIIVIFLALTAALTLCISKTNYYTQDREHVTEGSSRHHWSGTDDLGRDRTARLAGALMIGLTGAVCASALATFLAIFIGTVAAFTHEIVADVLMYTSDLFLTLPWLFLIMMIRSVLPLTMTPTQSAALTFLVLGLLSWPVYVRVTYAGAMSARNSDWMIHGRAMGLQKWQLARHYLVPHLRSLTLSQFLMLIPVCLVAEANLGTLGLGVSEPLPSYGSMLLALQHPAMLGGSYWSYAPILLLIVVLSLIELIVIEV